MRSILSISILCPMKRLLLFAVLLGAVALTPLVFAQPAGPQPWWPVQIRDFHATLLQLMGFDHEKLTFRLAGLDYRLTGVEEGHVVKELLA